MIKYDPNKLMEVMRREPRPNEYEAMAKEARSEHYYRPHEYGQNRSGRREASQYANSIARLLPSPPKSAPMTRSVMEKLFRGKSGKQKREEREEKLRAARFARHLEAEEKRKAAETA